MAIALANARVLTPEGFADGRAVLIERGRITGAEGSRGRQQRHLPYAEIRAASTTG